MKWFRLKWRDDGTYLSGHIWSEAIWSHNRKAALVLPKEAAVALRKTFKTGIDDIALMVAEDATLDSWE